MVIATRAMFHDRVPIRGEVDRLVPPGRLTRAVICGPGHNFNTPQKKIF